jgi:hypothetical protein
MGNKGSKQNFPREKSYMDTDGRKGHQIFPEIGFVNPDTH